MIPETSPSVPPPTSWGGRIVLFFRVLQMRLRFLVIFVLAGLVVAYWERIDAWYDRLTRPAVVQLEKGAEAFEYRCPMHPQVVRDHPDNCPICGMPLSKRAKGQPAARPADSLARIQLTPYKMQLGQVATSEVRPMFLSRELRQYGDIELDQTRLVDVPAKVRGRVKKLFVSYDGQAVQAGQPLLELFSQDLYQALREFVQNLRRSRQLLAAQSTLAELAVTRRKLETYGVGPDLIREIEQSPQTQGGVLVNAPIDVPILLPVAAPVTGTVMKIGVLKGQNVNEGDMMYVLADLSKVWLQIRLFEDQLGTVGPGSAVEVRTTAYPQETFIGKVTFLAPRVDPSTRTVAARVEVDNPDYHLRPGMYAEAILRTPADKVEPLSMDLTSPACLQGDEAGHRSLQTQPTTSPPQTLVGARPPSSQPGLVVPQNLVDAYLSLCAALAGDKNDPAVVQALSLAAQSLPAQKFGELQDALGTLSKAEGLEATRQALVDVSDYLISALDKTGQLERYYVVYCSMKPGRWLQKEAQVNNPYFGSGMLRCGEIKHQPATGRPTSQPSPSGPASQASTAKVGYYCPLTPERVFDHPGQCPIERAPMIYARLEPVPAIPESAVIDTGAHKFVYVEADPDRWGPGVFDLVEVKLAPAAQSEGGRYYPVLGGLNAGQRVVTRGTFAVDAENRLSGSYPP